MSTIIQTNQLSKSYGRSRGIIDVTFDIQEGEVFGFLGDGVALYPTPNTFPLSPAGAATPYRASRVGSTS